MAVFRVEKNANYTTMSNYHLRDKQLSLKAKGLLSFCLSLPDTWDYSIMGLAAVCKEGRDCIMSTLQELEELGYLRRERTRNADGTLAGADYVIYELPQPVSEKPDTENPTQDKPTLEKPALGDPLQISTNSTSTERNNNEEKKVIRHKYGAYYNVLLSDEELLKLKTEFPSDWQSRIERLSEYMASTGRSYKSHLATIRSWSRREQPPSAQKKAHYSPSNYVYKEGESLYSAAVLHIVQDRFPGKKRLCGALRNEVKPYGRIYFCSQRFIQGEDQGIHEPDKEAAALLRCRSADWRSALLCPEKHRKYQLCGDGYDRCDDAHVLPCHV